MLPGNCQCRSSILRPAAPGQMKVSQPERCTPMENVPCHVDRQLVWWALLLATHPALRCANLHCALGVAGPLPLPLLCKTATTLPA